MCSVGVGRGVSSPLLFALFSTFLYTHVTLSCPLLGETHRQPKMLVEESRIEYRSCTPRTTYARSFSTTRLSFEVSGLGVGRGRGGGERGENRGEACRGLLGLGGRSFPSIALHL